MAPALARPSPLPNSPPPPPPLPSHAAQEVWNKIGATSKDKPETRVAWAEEVAPKYLALLTARLGAGPFFAGAAPGWQDCWVYVFISFSTSGFFDHVPQDFVARHAPALAEFFARFKASELYTSFGNAE